MSRSPEGGKRASRWGVPVSLPPWPVRRTVGAAAGSGGDEAVGTDAGPAGDAVVGTDGVPAGDVIVAGDVAVGATSPRC